MRLARILRGVGANVLDKGVMTAIQLITVNVLALHWGLERYGTWAMVAAIPGFLALANLGFGVAAAANMTMQIARGETQAARATAHTAWVMLAIIAAGLFGLTALALAVGQGWGIGPIAGMDARASATAIYALVGYTVLVLVSGQVQATFRSSGLFATGTLLATMTIVLENALLFAVVMNDGSIAGGALAWLVGRGIGLGVQVLVAARLVPVLRPGFSAARYDVFRTLLPLAIGALALPVATALLLQGTVMTLGIFAAPAAVPAFVAARTLSRIAMQASQLLVTALMPEFGAITATDDKRRAGHMVAAVVLSAAIFTLPVALALGVAGPWIVDIWTAGKIHADATLMIVIALSAAMSGFWYPLSNLLLAVNRQGVYVGIYLVVAIAAIGLTALGGPLYGSLAAAVATAMVDAVVLFVIGRYIWATWIREQGMMAILHDMAIEGRAVLRRLHVR